MRIPAVLFLIVVSVSLGAQGLQITTVAGIGAAADSGDNGLAISAALSSPSGVAVDAKGSLFVADSGNHRIRKISSDGTIRTVAGSGKAGGSGDGGPAVSARLFAPAAVVVDDAGELYVADTYNNRIRMVDTHGVIITVAGTGTAGYSGEGGSAAFATIDGPTGIALDSRGVLLFVDGRYRVRMVDAKGVISTVAGSGVAGFSGDGGRASAAQLNEASAVAMDRQGNIFIADSLNNRVRKVDPRGIIQTIAGTGVGGYSGDGGPATSATLKYPTGVAIDSQNNIYISDSGNNRIRRVDALGVIATIAGTGEAGFSRDGDSATNAKLSFPAGLVVDAEGNLYVADQNNNRIRKIATR